MESGYKYTKDRQKVFVCGQLNSEEHIVQEVFTDEEGNEFPAGEKFCVKTLLDEPAKTWKERKLEDLEEQYEKQRKDLESKQAELRKRQQMDDDFLRWIKQFDRNAYIKQLDTLQMFVAGEIRYLVISDLFLPEIKPFPDHLRSSDEFDPTDIKLITLFGRSDGTLNWKINRYSDGSGRNQTIIPARSYEEAVNIAQELYNQEVEEWRERREKAKSDSRLGDLADAKKHVPELVIPEDVKEAYRERERQKRQKRKQELEEELAALREEEE